MMIKNLCYSEGGLARLEDAQGVVLGSVWRGKGGGEARENREWQTLSFRRRLKPQGVGGYIETHMLPAKEIENATRGRAPRGLPPPPDPPIWACWGRPRGVITHGVLLDTFCYKYNI